MKIGRNDPCSCGSGKKWKKCCDLVKVAAPVAAPVAVATAPAPIDEAAAAADQAEAERREKTWVPMQHQPGLLRPNRFGRKKNR